MPWNEPRRKTVAPNAKRMAPKLRRETTPAERALWKGLRGAIDVPGTHFRRQVPLGPYVVDFCCLLHRVIVEVDGPIHDGEAAVLYDRQRDDFLRREGFVIMRVTNDDVLTRLPTVLDRLKAAIGASTPTPGPSPQGGGEQRSAS